MSRMPSKLFGCLERAVHESGHARPDHGHSTFSHVEVPLQESRLRRW
jgi:hypothetical protein